MDPTDERAPLPLTPTERIALEFIRAGKTPSAAALEAVMHGKWARNIKGAVEITVAGEKALAEDAKARLRTRRGQWRGRR
jgi:hypothetical protein